METTQSSTLKVFLCHAFVDKPKVRNLYERLGQDGFEPWLDEKDLVPGQEWEAEIRKKIRSFDAVVICLTDAAATKTGFIQEEIRLTIEAARRQPPGTIFLIPAKLEPCDVPDQLHEWTWVELFRDEGYSRLVTALKIRAEQLGKELARSPDQDRIRRRTRTLSGFQVKEELTRILLKLEKKMQGIQVGQTETLDILRASHSEILLIVRTILRSQAAENKEHPSLFTLIPSGGGITHDKWELTLWCQHPGHEHAVDEATYPVPEPKEWVVRLTPAIRLLGQMLRLAVGVADFSGLSQSVVELTKKQADGMQKILKELPADDRRLDDHVRDEGGRLTPAQGAAFRQLRSLLRELDPAEGWGRLRRFQTNEGDWLWICPVHSKLQQYDPGYPVLPEQQPKGRGAGLRGS